MKSDKLCGITSEKMQKKKESILILLMDIQTIAIV